MDAALATRTAPLDGMTPCEVAAALSHLDGLVFFDTAGHLPASYGAPLAASSLSDLEQRQIHPTLPCSAHGRPVRQH